MNPIPQFILNQLAQPVSCRLIRVGRKHWAITNLERPGETLHGPLFKLKREAMEYANQNAELVCMRIREGY